MVDAIIKRALQNNVNYIKRSEEPNESYIKIFLKL